MANPWETPIRFVKGVGPTRAAWFERRLGIRTVGDLLTTLPRRLADRTRLRDIGTLQPGEQVVVAGRIERVATRRLRGRFAITEARLADDTGRVAAVWFNQPYLQKTLAPGDRLVLEGAVRRYRGLQIQVREFARADAGSEATGWLALYPLADGIGQKTFRAIVRAAVEQHGPAIPEILPDWVLAKRGLMARADAIRAAHRPSDPAEFERARRRLAYEELFALQAWMAARRRLRERSPPAVRMRDWKGLRIRIQSRIPFKLTRAQQRAVDEILRDMSRPAPMSRLLQGDVGSGKTVVALAAALFAIANRAQACVMAPTEILARQHFDTFERLLAGSRVRLALLTSGARRGAAKEADLVVGTHSLLERDVGFRRLGLVVIDEQHKFGVAQRAELAAKGGGEPHLLVMSATPIPRTLALAVYGSLDLTVIDEMPPGRRPPRTLFRPAEKLDEVCEFIRRKLVEGRQAYFVYPVIDESELLAQVRAATTMAGALRRRLGPAHRVELLHGRLKPAEKEAIMAGFREGRVAALVSTLVIEVGVDVPNATVMAIDHSERFGLSQLHQLRGRIGRGAHDSYCILMGRAATPESKARIDAMLRTHDGFKIAEEDLRIRGPGELLGLRQSGLPPLRIADLAADVKPLAEAREDAREFVERRPGLDALRGGAFLAEMRVRFGIPKRLTGDA
jgi:ATP-dependent DNA helicase RecG